MDTDSDIDINSPATSPLVPLGPVFGSHITDTLKAQPILDVLKPQLEGRVICGGRFRLLSCRDDCNSSSENVDEQYLIFKAEEKASGNHVLCKCVYIHPLASSTAWLEGKVHQECSNVSIGVAEVLAMQCDKALPIFYLVTEYYDDDVSLCSRIATQSYTLPSELIFMRYIFWRILTTLEDCQKTGVYFTSLNPNHIAHKEDTRNIIFTTFTDAKCVKELDVLNAVGIWPNVDPKPSQAHMTNAFMAPGEV